METTTAQELRETAEEALRLAAKCHERVQRIADEPEGGVWTKPLEELAKLLRPHALALEREVELHA